MERRKESSDTELKSVCRVPCEGSLKGMVHDDDDEDDGDDDDVRCNPSMMLMLLRRPLLPQSDAAPSLPLFHPRAKRHERWQS